MKNILLILTITMVAVHGYSQNPVILNVFNDQVDAFNQADVERLVNNVSDDFKYFYITSDDLILEVEGKEKFKTSMENYFKADRKVISKIENYSIDGNKISFREVVGHKNSKGEFVSSSALGVYEIKNGKITRSWYFID